MIQQPLGRLVALQFRQAGAVPQQPTAVLRVHIRGPDGEDYYHDLPNGMWVVNNPALQFLAKWGYKPSDIGDKNSTMRDCMDDTVVLSVAPQNGEYVLAQNAMNGAEQALRDAEWFDGADDSTEQGTAQTPAGGHVDKDGGPSVQRAGEDSDSGVIISTEE